mgnify:FL=1
MPRYKEVDYSQMLLIPVSLKNQLVQGSLEYAIFHLVENHLDLSDFDSYFKNDRRGATAYHPKILLKIVLFAYSRGIIGSRSIEKACKENITFMALSGCSTPDHSTIADFITKMKVSVLKCFQDVLAICDQMGLLGGTAFSVDGTKLTSNASKEWSGTFEDFKKKQEKWQERIQKLMEKQQEIDQQKQTETLQEEREKYEKKILKLQKGLEKMKQFIETNEPKKGFRNNEILSNITDNESATMFSSNHGGQQGYNVQSLVDEKHQIIVYSEAIGSANDQANFRPVLEGAKSNMQAIGYKESYFEGKEIKGDSGYFNEETLNYCEEEKIDAYIPDPLKNKRLEQEGKKEKRKSKRSKFSREDFRFDEAKQEYICPNGKRLKRTEKRSKHRNTFHSTYEAKQEDCCVCPLRGQCLKTTTTLKKYLSIVVGLVKETASERMRKKMETAEAKKKYEKRLGGIEPVFGNVRSNKKMDRLTLRGKGKVNIQWLLYGMVHNMEKISNYGTSLVA